MLGQWLNMLGRKVPVEGLEPTLPLQEADFESAASAIPPYRQGGEDRRGEGGGKVEKGGFAYMWQPH